MTRTTDVCTVVRMNTRPPANTHCPGCTQPLVWLQRVAATEGVTLDGAPVDVAWHDTCARSAAACGELRVLVAAVRDDLVSA